MLLSILMKEPFTKPQILLVELKNLTIFLDMYLCIVSLTGLKTALVFLFMLLNNTTQFWKFVSQTCMMKTEKVQKQKLSAWQ